MSLADALKKKAAQLKSKNSDIKTSSSPKKSTKTEPKKASKKGAKKESTPRVQIKDKKGKIVTGRDQVFTCVECGESITGPWSYKTHLVKQHDYSRAKAGLRG